MRSLKRGSIRGRRLLIGAFVAAVALLAMAPASSFAAGNDVNTTVVQGGGACQNGDGEPNCNIYLDKSDVYLSGAQHINGKGLADGDYFFAVLDPGGQADPTDGAAKNLSSPHDSYAARKFNVANGVITNTGTHAGGTGLNSEPVIQAMPYDDTSNPGGVYIMAVCKWLGDGAANDATDPSKCKYDAFKIKSGDEVQPPTAPVVTKDASATFKRTFPWSVSKSVDKTLFQQLGGSATANYTITATKGDAVDSDWVVKGTITVTNFNDGPVTLHDVSDDIGDPSATCVLDQPATLVVPANSENDYPYTCTYTAAGPDLTKTVNTAKATWNDQDVNGQTLAGNDGTGTANFAFGTDPTADNPKVVDDCTTATDTLDGATTTLGHPCATTTYTPSATFNVPRSGCDDHANTATETTDDLALKNSASASVRVCGPVGGEGTMGFWQNTNGQKVITSGASTYGVCNSGAYLRTYAPFQDLSATANCKDVAAYVTKIVKAASASGAAMNAMLKAQMLSTALDVFFGKVPGNVNMDLTKVNKPIASANFENVSAAFGGATKLTVGQMLAYAATQSNAGGSSWYGQVKATQELAKDAFDAVNNGVALSI
jgi:hypothetical protein